MFLILLWQEQNGSWQCLCSLSSQCMLVRGKAQGSAGQNVYSCNRNVLVEKCLLQVEAGVGMQKYLSWQNKYALSKNLDTASYNYVHGSLTSHFNQRKPPAILLKACSLCLRFATQSILPSERQGNVTILFFCLFVCFLCRNHALPNSIYS